ncbi:hypothetical protein KR200_004995 [Drosophila serrata]|nr:hypothetical protein KR200_004995 [Drosophila serrata]
MAKMKNKAPEEVQITAVQLLCEAKERDLEILPPPPKQKTSPPAQGANRGAISGLQHTREVRRWGWRQGRDRFRAQFEIRYKKLQALGLAIGMCPREFERCRVLYQKFLEFHATAQNPTLLKGKMRTKQEPARPALSTLKTGNGQLAGQNKVVGHMATVQQQQQATANLQQNGCDEHDGHSHYAPTAGVDKQQQQQQQQLQLIQKEQYLQQQMFQQQIAALQMQQQVAAQAQQQQQQRQQQLHNQLIQQQLQQLVQAQAQAQQQQQREQQQNIIQQIVVSGGTTPEQQNAGQLQQKSVAFTVSSTTTPAGLATSSAIGGSSASTPTKETPSKTDTLVPIGQKHDVEILNTSQSSCDCSTPSSRSATRSCSGLATAGLQSFGSNQIILSGQADGTSGMFIRQPATQTLQTQQNLSSDVIQCNVTQTPPKACTQLDALAPKQQHQQEQKQKQQLAQQQQVTAHQQQAVAQAQQQQREQQHQQRQQQLHNLLIQQQLQTPLCPLDRSATSKSSTLANTGKPLRRFEEDQKDNDRARIIYKYGRSHSAQWLFYAQFEIRYKELQRARKALGLAKRVRGYIDLEIQLCEFERCRLPSCPRRRPVDLRCAIRDPLQGAAAGSQRLDCSPAVPKQQQQQEQKQKQQLAVATARLQQQQQLTSAALQYPGAPILPHSGTQSEQQQEQQVVQSQTQAQQQQALANATRQILQESLRGRPERE